MKMIMKGKNVCSMFFVALVCGLLMVSCGTKKTVESGGVDLRGVSDASYVRGVLDNAPEFDEFTAKIKLSAAYGAEKISVGGSIKMKKDEVIQLSLVAVGIVEAARIEFTPKRMLVLDRIGRRYVEVAYDDIKFFDDSKIDFYTLQALFWNELFLSGAKHVDKSDVFDFKVVRGDTHATLAARGSKRLSYTFLTTLVEGLLKESHVHVASSKNAGYEMVWNYADFIPLGGKQFPARMEMSLKGSEKPIVASFDFSRWDTQVTYEPIAIPKRYKKLESVDILKMLLTL